MDKIKKAPNLGRMVLCEPQEEEVQTYLWTFNVVKPILDKVLCV